MNTPITSPTFGSCILNFSNIMGLLNKNEASAPEIVVLIVCMLTGGSVFSHGPHSIPNFLTQAFYPCFPAASPRTSISTLMQDYLMHISNLWQGDPRMCMHTLCLAICVVMC